MNRRSFLKVAAVVTASSPLWACNLPGTAQGAFSTPRAEASQTTGPDVLPSGTPFPTNTPNATVPVTPSPAAEAIKDFNPMLAAEDMADVLLGRGQWYEAPEFSFSIVRAYIKERVDKPDLSTPGRILVTDPVGVNETQPGAVDVFANATTYLFVPNYHNLEPEMHAVQAQDAQRANLDSFFSWFHGHGLVNITYLWGDGTKTNMSGRVDGDTFRGRIARENDAPLEVNMPAAFQMAYFRPDTGALDAVPAAIVFHMVADPRSYIELQSGPSSCYDSDGEGILDYPDAGFCFAPAKK